MPPGPRKGVQIIEDGLEDEESQCCPICLNVPHPSECARPDSCNHLYCLNCLLRWAQLLQICPVDRRPFSSVYKWDPFLGYIKIPVKTSSLLSTCLSASKNDKGFSIEEMGENEKKRTSAEHKTRTRDVESLPKRKMVEWETCRSQLLTWNSQHGLSGQQGETLGVLTHAIAETEVMTEEEMVDRDWRPCQRNAVARQWLSVPIATPYICVPRQCPRGHSFVQKPVLSTSPCLTDSGFPVQSGKVCAVTCPKGGGRKGSRGSGLKGSGTKAVNVTTTRSTRSRKGKSLNEETVSQQSGPSSSSAAGSDSNDVPASTSKPRSTGKRKPTAKRKGRTKKMAAQLSVVESAEEDEKEEQENGQNSLEEPDAAGKMQKDEQISQEESDASDNERDNLTKQEESDADGNERDGLEGQEEAQEDWQKHQSELVADANEEDEPEESDLDVNEQDEQKSQEESDADVNTQDDLKIQEESDVDLKEGDLQESDEQSDVDLNEHSGQKSPVESDDDVNTQDDLKIQEESDIDVKEADSQESDDQSDADLNEQSRQKSPEESDEDVNELDDQKSPDMEEVQDGRKQQDEPNADTEEKDNECLEEASDSTDESDTNMDLQELGTVEERQANWSLCHGDVSESVDHDGEDDNMHVVAESDHEEKMCADKQNDNQMLHQEDSMEQKEPLVSLEKQIPLSSPSTVLSVAMDSLPTAMEGSSDDVTNSKPETRCENKTDGLHTSLVFGSPSANCTEAASETKQEESQDNIELIPMDCDSPESGNASPEGDLVVETAVPTLPMLPVDQTLSQQNEAQEQKSETKSEDQKGSDKTDKRPRKSRFHSPTTTWSPKSESRREGSRRSRSRSRDRSRRDSPRRSRGREHEDDRGSSRRNRSRDRYSRRRSRSRSRNRSRSRSRSRNRTNNRGSSSERSDSRAHSPKKRDSWGGDNWRGSHNSRNSNWRSSSDRPSQFPGREANSSSNGSHHPSEKSPDRSQSENSHWGKERSWFNNDSRDREKPQEKCDAPSDSWSRGGRGRGFDQGHASGCGRGGQRFSGQYGESADNWRQPRNSFSGMANNTGSDSYSSFNENRPGGKRKENESSDPPLDRSGWSAASSWAVRRTLPADVQNYYSRRGRGPGPGGSIWNKQDEEQPAAGVSKQTDPPQSEPNTHIPNEAVPAPPTVLPHQLNMIGVLRYPVGPVGPQGTPLAIHPAPFTMPTQIPIHLPPPGPPLSSMSTMNMQGLPPPPPPPPPVQQGSFTLLPSETIPQVGTSMSVPGKGLVKASPNKAPLQAPFSFNTASIAQPSSTTQPNSHSKAHADSSKKEKKLQIQEKAVAEVKAAIKPYYQNKDITKDEYKEIVRKAVEKVCHSKSGEVNTSKVANLVKAYVDKYKHARKNKTDKN